MSSIIFVHGYESSGKGFKGQYLRGIFPDILTPDFKGPLERRMKQLNAILDKKNEWIIIGSSFGGLMSALYTLEKPEKISLLILLAPLLVYRRIDSIKRKVEVPVIIFHGKNDDIVPLNATRARAEELFTNLDYNAVDDDHVLRSTTKKLNWQELVKKI